jgi:TIGR02300 family protein
LANPELGTKQICPNCQAKFYDLGKRPAHCPKCHSEFDPDEAVRNRRVRARAVTPDTEADDEREDQVTDETERDEDEEEDIATPELDEVADEPPLVTDDDDDSAEPGPAVTEDLGEFTDDEEVADDVQFLEDEEDDDFDDSEIEGLPDEGDDEDR